MKYSRIMGAPIVMLLFVFPNVQADAFHSRHGYHHHHHRSNRDIAHRMHRARLRMSDGGCVLTNDGREICGAAGRRRSTAVEDNGYRAYASVNAYASADSGSVIGSRPAGCPHAYCGCGLRKYLGLADVRLNLAHNWARLFPHETAPRPGLAAVRAHHVMYIEAAEGNGEWLIRDYNSGGGLSRMHVRDLHGYVFVDPHG